MKGFVVAIGVSFAAFFVAGLVGYRLNVSDSLPHGIYRVDKSAQAAVGELALVCVPAGFGTRMGWDRCPSGQHPVLKRILAGGGTCVERDGFTLRVGELAIPLWEDSPVEYTGNHCLEDTEIWLYSPHPVSWDSRYYGAVSTESVLGRVEAIWLRGAQRKGNHLRVPRANRNRGEGRRRRSFRTLTDTRRKARVK